jgi:hypothetical protein
MKFEKSFCKSYLSYTCYNYYKYKGLSYKDYSKEPKRGEIVNFDSQEFCFYDKADKVKFKGQSFIYDSAYSSPGYHCYKENDCDYCREMWTLKYPFAKCGHHLKDEYHKKQDMCDDCIKEKKKQECGIKTNHEIIRYNKSCGCVYMQCQCKFKDNQIIECKACHEYWWSCNSC